MAKNLRPMDALIAGYLQDGIKAAGLSYRQIASSTGKSINRIGIILRQEPPPATIGEVGMLAATIGTTASTLVERAEVAIHVGKYALAASDDDDWQARQEAEIE